MFQMNSHDGHNNIFLHEAYFISQCHIKSEKSDYKNMKKCLHSHTTGL